MKKFFVLLACFCFLVTPSVARTKRNQRQKKVPVTAPTAKEKEGGSPEERIYRNFLQQAKEQAGKDKHSAGPRILSWKEFDAEAKNFVSYGKILNTSIPVPVRCGYVKNAQSGEPDWAALLGDEKFLFLGETIFGSPSSLEAVKSAVRALKAKFPEKNILLATEFVQNTVPNTRLLHKAGQERNPKLREKYPLFSFADEQKIDLLSLDDLIFSVIKDEPYLKLGNEYVAIPYVLPEAKEALNNAIRQETFQGPNSLLSEELSQGSNSLLFTEEILKQTLYGIKNTNELWAQRIRAVENHYDIIIVYTLDDHYLMGATSLPTPLKARTAPVVILSSPIGEATAYRQAEYINTINTIEDLQFNELKNQLAVKAAETKDVLSQNLYSLKIMDIHNSQSNFLTDLFSRERSIRSFHANYVALQTASATGAVVSEDDAKNAFVHPFWAEINTSEEIIQQQPGGTMQIMHEEEGRVLFYHVGETTQAAYVPLQ